MSVRVVARIRPLLEKELDKDTIVRVDSVEAGKPCTIIKIPNPKNEGEEFSFAFNGVYDQSTAQETLFTSEGLFHHRRSPASSQDVNIPSGASSQIVIPRHRFNHLCLWSKWFRQDSHRPRRNEAGRSWGDSPITEWNIQAWEEDHERL